MVAQCTAAALPGGDYYRAALCAALEAEGHKVQQLDLPSIASPGRALNNLASLRLLGTELTADALICLDPVAAVLQHSCKIVILLDDSYLASDRVALRCEQPADRHYIANVLQSALGEADHIFTLSHFASQSLRALSIQPAVLIQPTIEIAPCAYVRHKGPELLALGRLDERQRPELLITCLARLPEPLRARWIAPEASTTRVADLYQLARELGVEQRFAIDVRRVNAGEKAYLLAHAAALIDIAPGALAVGETAMQAVRTGVPVITCIDGGASVELVGAESPDPANVDAAAVVAAIRTAWDASSIQANIRLRPDGTSGTGWAPLLKAVAR